MALLLWFPSLSVLRLWLISDIGYPLQPLLKLIDIFSHRQKSTELFPVGQSQESLLHLLFGHHHSFFLVRLLIIWINVWRVRLLSTMDGLGFATVLLRGRGVWWLVVNHRRFLLYLLLMFLIIIIINFLMLWLRPWAKPGSWGAPRWRFIVRVGTGSYESWPL